MLRDKIKLFINPFDARYEDMKGKWQLVVLRDFSAGLIVAMMAIPLAMGFAMASGLKPEQGIVSGAVAGLVGALFGGSKYQVNGPTAAFIPVLAGVMSAYAPLYGAASAHGLLVLASIFAGIILMGMGLGGLGKLARLVPHSIVVGFTIGIAFTIALSQVGEVLGLHAGFEITPQVLKNLEKEGVGKETLEKLVSMQGMAFETKEKFLSGLAKTGGLSNVELENAKKTMLKNAELVMPSHFIAKARIIWAHLGEFNGDTLIVALVTFLITRDLLKFSIYIPAPLIAIAVGIFLSKALHDPHVILIGEKFGRIPTDFFVFTPPGLPALEPGIFLTLFYLTGAIVFVSGVESILCSRMADRLANNKGTPFNPDKEFWGQGLVQVFVPLLNGFPNTGALARTASNIKVGAVTPLSGIFICVLKLLLAFFLAPYLEQVPMACIGGILFWVALNMVKPAEIKEVFNHNWFHTSLMVFTATAVIFTNFLTGVLSALIVFALLHRHFDKPGETEPEPIMNSGKFD